MKSKLISIALSVMCLNAFGNSLSAAAELKSANSKRIIFKNVKSASTRSMPISSNTHRNRYGQSTTVSFTSSDYRSGRKIKVNIMGDSISTNGDEYFISMAPWFDSGEEAGMHSMKGYQKVELVGVATGFSGPPHTSYALPKDISVALKQSDTVYVNVTAFPTTNGTYKAKDFPFSFTMQLADKGESAEPQSKPETPEEEPAGTTPHTWAPSIEKDFKIFKEEVMSEIADLKKMINHLTEKMNK